MNPFTIFSDGAPYQARHMSATLALTIAQLIRYRGQETRDFPLGKNGLRVDFDMTWSGYPNHKEFFRFMSTLMNRMHLINVMGEDADEIRIRLLQTCLKGEALAWIERNVNSATRTYRN